MKKILVIDDEAMYISMYKALVKQVFQNKVELHAAQRGAEGVALALVHQPHLILVDYLMPDMNGAQVISRLRADERTKGIPVVLVTSADQSAVGDIPYSIFLSKPVKPDMLRELGERYLKITCI